MPASVLIDVQTLLVTLSLVMPRALVCMQIVPGFSFSTLPGMLRAIVSMAVALPAALPTYYFVQQTPIDYFLGGVLILKEVAIGGLLGTLLAIPMWVVQSICAVSDAQRSPIQIQANTASADRDASATGAVMVQAMVLVMMQAGLFVALTRIVIESYAAWPAFTFAPPFEPGHFDVAVKRFGELYWLIIVYGAPVVIPLLMVEFAFAMLGVFASNLQVSFASSPIKGLLGLLMLILYWPTWSHYTAGDFGRLLDLAAQLMQAGAKR